MKAQIALLQSEISISNNNNLGVSQTVEESPMIEYYKPDMELNQSISIMETSNLKGSISPRPLNKKYHNLNSNSNNANIDDIELNDLNNASTLTAEDTYVTSPHKTPAIPKMAERIRLRCASKSDMENITAMDLRNKEVRNILLLLDLLIKMKSNF